ncbi:MULTISPECIES: TVP38/TMEM64 family protein [Clostridium]|uniref:TVP38/TMEM64 family protein n=1 Tax=Clostridium TaxID=1485 RepID=UPI0017D3805F|nr:MULTISPECIES: TVP38/TMEM64 family protein [Clostridium]NOW13437.1 putative membrane protein YdjX (TVP38/TMEM64 family) [Clostridium acetobutylicum]NYC93333.1 putative membrane protein YdjX (TVP38/TMEM64 family) [Clostridium acetobutylicum]
MQERIIYSYKLKILDVEVFDLIRNLYNKIKNCKLKIAAIILLIFLIVTGYIYYSRYFYVLRSPQRVKEFILSYGKFGFFAFFVMQMLQVVAFFIPGEIIQIAGGYIFGTFWGTVISLLGITAGSAVAFYLSNKLGRPFVKKISGKQNISFFEKLIKNGEIKYVITLIYLVPGLPKDILAYVCGITDLSLKDFIIYSTIGRFPGIFISAYFGNTITHGNIKMMVIIAVISVVLFGLGVFKGKYLLTKISSIRSKKQK